MGTMVTNQHCPEDRLDNVKCGHRALHLMSMLAGHKDLSTWHIVGVQKACAEPMTDKNTIKKSNPISLLNHNPHTQEGQTETSALLEVGGLYQLGCGASFDINCTGDFPGPHFSHLVGPGDMVFCCFTLLSQKKKKSQRKWITVSGGKTARLWGFDSSSWYWSGVSISYKVSRHFAQRSVTWLIILWYLLRNMLSLSQPGGSSSQVCFSLVCFGLTSWDWGWDHWTWSSSQFWINRYSWVEQWRQILFVGMLAVWKGKALENLRQV